MNFMQNTDIFLLKRNKKKKKKKEKEKRQKRLTFYVILAH